MQLNDSVGASYDSNNYSDLNYIERAHKKAPGFPEAF